MIKQRLNKVILTLTALLLTGCFSPQKYKNKEEILNSMLQSIEKKHPSVKNLEPLQLKAMRESDKSIIILDVREEDERLISSIPGSISVDEFNKNQAVYKDKTIISYCTIGMRSSQFTEQLNKKGFKAYNLRGGVLSWSHAGLTYQKDGKDTKKVHVYSEAWDFLAEGYEGVW